MHMDEVLAVDVVADQLRRRVPGGTGTYARGLLMGMKDTTSLRATVTVSRPAKGQPTDLGLGLPTHAWPLPQPFSQPFVDHGIFRANRRARMVHSVSLGGPTPRKGQRSTVAIHDLLWRSSTATLTPRGAKWHAQAYAKAKRDCCGVVTGAASIAEELIADGWHRDQVLVAPHGADHLLPPNRPAARALLERHGIRSSYLVTASTLEPRKNLRRVVAAHAQLQKAGVDLPLVVVGPSGWGSDGLEGASSSVVAVGHVPDDVLSALLADAEVVLSLSLAEGYGLPVLEAMSLGAVVLASNTTPAATELGAAVVDPLDINAMAEVIAQLLHHDDERAQRRMDALVATKSRTWANAAQLHEAFWRRYV